MYGICTSNCMQKSYNLCGIKSYQNELFFRVSNTPNGFFRPLWLEAADSVYTGIAANYHGSIAVDFAVKVSRLTRNKVVSGELFIFSELMNEYTAVKNISVDSIDETMDDEQTNGLEQSSSFSKFYGERGVNVTLLKRLRDYSG